MNLLGRDPFLSLLGLIVLIVATLDAWAFAINFKRYGGDGESK